MKKHISFCPCRLNGFPAERVFEYQWPQDGGEWYLLQEQISEYLGIKSFKRKYPGNVDYFDVFHSL